MEVLEALLWGFHNYKDGRCFPSYETIAARARCNRDTVYEAIKALEFAGVLTWVNRITRIRTKERDLFGQWTSRWRIIRISNAYSFHDPGLKTPVNQQVSSKSENPPGTYKQEDSYTSIASALAETEAVKAARDALDRVRTQREAILAASA